MMKKWFFVLMLVFGLISTVQAEYARFELASGSTVAPGQTITLNLVSDLACNGWFIDGVAEVDSSGNQTVLPYGGSVSNVRAHSSAIFADAGYMDNYQGSLFSLNQGAFLGALEAGQAIMSFDYTINSAWDGSAITIAPLALGNTYTYLPDTSSIVGDSTADIGTIGNKVIEGITIVPEPITVALLGIGGLFLRRKK